MMKSIFIFSVCLISLVIFGGCQAPNAQSAKLARLDAHLSHNLRLELMEKDKQILELQKELERCNSELEKHTKIATDCQNEKANEFMEMINPIMDELSKVKLENVELKAELEKLKSGPKVEDTNTSSVEPNAPAVQ